VPDKVGVAVMAPAAADSSRRDGVDGNCSSSGRGVVMVLVVVVVLLLLLLLLPPLDAAGGVRQRNGGFAPTWR
jgi:hypothetical protein